MRNLLRSLTRSFANVEKLKYLATSVAPLLFLLAGSPAMSQIIQWGLKAGIPATDNFQTISSSPLRSFTSSTNRYTLGPTIEISLPFRLGLEVDATIQVTSL